MSQRELARRIGMSKSAVARIESGLGGLDARLLAQAAALAGLRISLVDQSDVEVSGMNEGAVRDMGNRRFPAHLDTRYSDEDWWHGPHRYDREQPWYTFDRDRRTRDAYRLRDGTPDDHQLPQPGDSPQERSAARRRAAARARVEERERRFLAGELRHLDDGFTCTCPPGCDELDDRGGRPVHADECACGCDVS